MSAKHTPGPWGTHFHPAHGHCITEVNECGNPKNSDIAVVFMAGNGRTTLQCKADARLIAAAPDLLAALERAERCIRGYTESSQRECNLEGIRAAIKAAKGEA